MLCGGRCGKGGEDKRKIHMDGFIGSTVVTESKGECVRGLD